MGINKNTPLWRYADSVSKFASSLFVIMYARLNNDSERHDLPHPRRGNRHAIRRN